MPMNPAAAVTWGSFVQAAYDQYASDPSQPSPAAIMNMPAGYTLVRTIQMTDFLGPVRSRVFYGFVAVGGDPRTAVVALRGTVGAAEWWDDLHWDLVPFTQVPDGGNVARGFFDIYGTYGTMTPGQQQGTRASPAFAADVAQAAASGLGAGLDPALPAVVCGHSLGGALATLLVADLTANTPLKPQAWTFASPRVGDAAFAGRYGGLSTVSWRIYNQADVVPYFPVDAAGSYQSVTAGYAINSLGKAKWSLRCAHALSTYLHVLAPATVPLNPACTLPAWQAVTALPEHGRAPTAPLKSPVWIPEERSAALPRPHAHARPPGTENARSWPHAVCRNRLGLGRSRRPGIMRGDEQVELQPIPRDRFAPSGHALPDLSPHRRAPALARRQRSPDRALPAGTPRSARAPCA